MAIAKRLCAEYDEATTPEKFLKKEMDKKKQKLLGDRAWTEFKMEAGREDVSRESFKKLLSRIRTAAKETPSLPTT